MREDLENQMPEEWKQRRSRKRKERKKRVMLYRGLAAGAMLIVLVVIGYGIGSRLISGGPQEAEAEMVAESSGQVMEDDAVTGDAISGSAGVATPAEAEALERARELQITQEPLWTAETLLAANTQE